MNLNVNREEDGSGYVVTLDTDTGEFGAEVYGPADDGRLCGRMLARLAPSHMTRAAAVAWAENALEHARMVAS